MGILPLQFRAGETAESLGLTGRERYDVVGLAPVIASGSTRGAEIAVRAHSDDGTTKELRAVVRIDTPQEARYFEHGGILPYVLRRLLGSADR
jgi:aconitate hydratase